MREIALFFYLSCENGIKFSLYKRNFWTIQHRMSMTDRHCGSWNRVHASMRLTMLPILSLTLLTTSISGLAFSSDAQQRLMITFIFSHELSQRAGEIGLPYYYTI